MRSDEGSKPRIDNALLAVLCLTLDLREEEEIMYAPALRDAWQRGLESNLIEVPDVDDVFAPLIYLTEDGRCALADLLGLTEEALAAIHSD